MKTKYKFKLSVLSILLAGLFLVSCGSNELSKDFSQDEVKTAAESVIKKLNAKDGAGIRDVGTVALGAALTDKVFEDVFKALAEGGKFVSIEDYAISGSKNKENGEEYAVVVTKVKYELKSFTFTMSFTKQMKLAGLFYR